MRTSRITATLLVLSVLAACGCSSKGNLKSDPGRFHASISVSDFDVVVQDKRRRVTEAGMKIPWITLPGQKRQIRPAIQIDLEETFRTLVDGFVAPGEREVTFTVEIIEGIMGFQAKLFSEVEHVRTKVKLTATERTTGEVLGSTSGLGWGTRKSLDASPRRLNRMFQQSLESALLDALGKMDLS